MAGLDRLLRPTSIAVFGGKEAERVIEQCQRLGFEGDIWPVHPRRDAIGGLRVFRSVDDLPGPPDAAFIGINRRATIPIVAALSRRGAGGAVCYASGFLEADDEGGALQAALVEAAGDMAVLGPNCYGLINYADGAALWPDQQGGTRLEAGGTGVAILTQSSNIALNLTMQRRGLPIAYLLTAGNQAQTGLSDLALAVLDDPRVSALGLHIEGFDTVSGMERLAARARALAKPVVVLKLGKSAEARAASLTHTASLAGSDAASAAFLRRLGIARLDSLPAFLEALKLLHMVGPLAGNTLSSMSCSGGEAALMADAAHGRQVSFRALTPEEKRPIEVALGPLVTVANPLDYHTYIWGDRDRMEAVFSGMIGAGFDLNCLVMDFPRDDICASGDWDVAIAAYQAAARRHKAKAAVVASLPENLPEARAVDLMARGLVPMAGIGEMLDAAEAAAFIGASWARPPAPPVMAEVLNDSGEHRVLDEAEAKAMLAEHGIPAPPGRRANTLDGALAIAGDIGFPLAVKALGLAHKTETGAVHLNLRNTGQVERAARECLALGGGIYLERMIESPVGELIVGFSHAPPFGLVMTLGSGGIEAELLADTAALLLPASRTDIEAAFHSLKLSPRFTGFRGAPRGDIPALFDAIEALQHFAMAHGDRLVEMDINPLIICPEGQGVRAADALIVLKEVKS